MGDPGDPSADPPVPAVEKLSYRKASAWVEQAFGAEIHYLMLRKHRLEDMGQPKPPVVEDVLRGLNELELAPDPPLPPTPTRAPAPVVPGAAPEGFDERAELMAPPLEQEPLPEPPTIVAERQPGARKTRAPVQQRRVTINLKGLPEDAETPITELLRAAADGTGRVTKATAEALDAWTTEYFKLLGRLKGRRARAHKEQNRAEAFDAEVALGQALLHGGHPLAQIVKARRIVSGGMLPPHMKGAIGEHAEETSGVKGLIGQLGERPPALEGDDADAPEEEAEIAKGYPEEETTAAVETHSVASLDDLPEEEPAGMDVVAIAERGREHEVTLVAADPGAEAAMAGGGEEGLAAAELSDEALEPTGTDAPAPRRGFIWQPPPKPRSPV